MSEDTERHGSVDWLALDEKRQGAVDWREVRGEEFTLVEARSAMDFSDWMVSCGLMLELIGDDEPSIREFFSSHRSIGQQLYLAEHLAEHLIGALLFSVEDPRIIRVIQNRVQDDKQQAAGGLIIL